MPSVDVLDSPLACTSGETPSAWSSETERMNGATNEVSVKVKWRTKVGDERNERRK